MSQGRGATAEARWFSATAALMATLYAARWLLRSRHLYEWDSAQYGLAIQNFNTYEHQPHPPGYPLWVLLLKALHLVIRDLIAVQVVLAYAASAFVAVLLYRLARDHFGGRRDLALLTTAIVVFSPPSVVTSVVANTYPADVLASVSIGFLASRALAGNARTGRTWLAPALAVLLALFAGFRQSGAVMLVPLAAVAIARAAGRDLKVWARTLAASVPVFLAWYVPVAWMHDGVSALQKYQSDNVRMYFTHFSVLFGAPPAAHLAMVRDIAWWSLVMLAVPAVVTIAVSAASRLVTRGVGPLRREARRRTSFLLVALWALPNLAYTLLLHCPKPFYLLLSLPPLALVLTEAVSGAANRFARARIAPAVVGYGVTALVVIGSSGLAFARYDAEPAVERATLASVRAADETADLVLDAVGREREDALVLMLGWSMYGPNVRTLEVELPRAHVWGFWTAGERRDARGGRERHVVATDHEVPDDVTRIVWVHAAGVALPRSVRAAFPDTREIFDSRTVHVFESNIDHAGVDAWVTVELMPVHLVRRGPLEGLPRCQLAGGFGEPPREGIPIWGYAPTSTLVLFAAESARASVELELLPVPLRSQTLGAFASGALLTESRVSAESPSNVSFAFDAHPGENRVELRYTERAPTRWGEAVLVSSLRCTVGGKTQTLVP